MVIDLRQRLSPHFTLAELVASQTAARKGIPNIPGPAEIRALTLLCENVLEPVRAHYGVPVLISSGYRCRRLNVAIGGSASSQHCAGEAADFEVTGVSNLAVCRWIHANLNYDQLIYEFGEAGWVHASWSAARMRNQELTATKRRGGTHYAAGIVG
jgi:zinc D-Ala-D-Ala carboxypeptidase